MGANIVRRLMRDGHECVVYDVSPEAVKSLEGEGATGAADLDEFVAKLDSPARRLGDGAGGRDHRAGGERPRRARMEAGDAIIDGGNSYYHDDIRRAAALGEKGIDYLDCGTSGGVFGLERGYCLMIGGPDEAYERLEPIFATLAPGVEAAERTPGRDGRSFTGRAGLPALRAQRRRPLREDGPQRDRVRGHGRLRRGAQRPAQCRRRQPQRSRRTPRPLRSSTPTTTASRSTSPRSPRSGGGAAWSAPGCSTSPRRRCASRPTSPISRAGCRTRARVAGPRSRRSRRGCRRPVLTIGSLLALCLAGPRRLRRQGALGDAQAVRGPRGKAWCLSSRSSRMPDWRPSAAPS